MDGYRPEIRMLTLSKMRSLLLAAIRSSSRRHRASWLGGPNSTEPCWLRGPVTKGV
jgi:hypothetical protein